MPDNFAHSVTGAAVWAIDASQTHRQRINADQTRHQHHHVSASNLVASSSSACTDIDTAASSLQPRAGNPQRASQTMCKWGTDVPLEVTIPASLSATGVARRKIVGVDACIAPVVKALNDAGMPTIASCCGHGRRPGNIALADGRELIIAPDYETARKIDALFPNNITDRPSLREVVVQWFTHW